MEKKVISWCLYIGDREDRIPEYLVGLRINQRAAKKWFPGWELRLYMDKNVKYRQDIYNYVLDVAKYGGTEIKVIEVDGTTNRTFDRYRPFFEKDVDVTIARDIDSILSKKDAELVEEWLTDERSHVLKYREYKMSKNMPMGGGIGIKKHIDADFPHIVGEHRGLDERNLSRVLQKYFEDENITEYQTRMLSTGVYCMYADKPEDAEILWSIPFYMNEKGYADDNITDLVEYCKSYPIKAQHIYSHYPHHNIDFTKNQEWVR